MSGTYDEVMFLFEKQQKYINKLAKLNNPNMFDTRNYSSKIRYCHKKLDIIRERLYELTGWDRSKVAI